MIKSKSMNSIESIDKKHPKKLLKIPTKNNINWKKTINSLLIHVDYINLTCYNNILSISKLEQSVHLKNLLTKHSNKFDYWNNIPLSHKKILVQHKKILDIINIIFIIINLNNLSISNKDIYYLETIISCIIFEPYSLSGSIIEFLINVTNI